MKQFGTFKNKSVAEGDFLILVLESLRAIKERSRSELEAEFKRDYSKNKRPVYLNIDAGRVWNIYQDLRDTASLRDVEPTWGNVEGKRRAFEAMFLDVLHYEAHNSGARARGQLFEMLVKTLRDYFAAWSYKAAGLGESYRLIADALID